MNKKLGSVGQNAVKRTFKTCNQDRCKCHGPGTDHDGIGINTSITIKAQFPYGTLLTNTRTSL